MIPQNDQKQVMAMDNVTANHPTTCRFDKRLMSHLTQTLWKGA
jgi:hypothetical protein